MVSSDEDDSRFRDSVDPTLFSDNLYKGDSKPSVQKKESNRYLLTEEQCVDVKTSSAMRNIVGQKISDIIDSQIVFVEVQNKTAANTEIVNSGIKLLRDSEKYLDPESIDEIKFVHKKPKGIKRRVVDDDCVVLKRWERAKIVSLSADSILNKTETMHWKSRRKQKLFEFKSTTNSSPN